ncbi:MAG: radical SAM protein [Spirochaetota bacterium]|nr:radical SAM protein [Spirochaetota bacterium]
MFNYFDRKVYSQNEKDYNGFLSQYKKLKIYLIKPSKYDQDGYPIRYLRGVFPSNSLICLKSLTQDVIDKRILGNVKISTEIIDESVQKISFSRITRDAAKKDTKILVCLVGVQTNQFPRASDLASSFRIAGVDVIIGGFHVSGAKKYSGEIPSEIQKIIDLGVIVVKGEVDEHWGDILRDILMERRRPVYDFMNERPDIYDAPLPEVDRKYLKRFAISKSRTIDCGRGCPFDCSFCTVINVQGRKMRYRDPGIIVDNIRKNYNIHGIDYYFFTDDNFSRHKHWEEIFDGLIALKENEGIKINFIMQVDTMAYRISRFVKKAREAGCNQVFIGMESLNEKNLSSAGKTHNNVHDYKEMISVWRDYAISTHVAYIIGFPYDTYLSVRDDIQCLKTDVQPDQASFFMLCPLPGSEDHMQMQKRCEYMEEDLNLYDSFSATTNHPLMDREEWTMAYRDAWNSFYDFKNMKAILNRAHPEVYWNLMKNFFWYKSSVFIENIHPMLSGFIRVKDRSNRRSGYPSEGWWKHFSKRYSETKVMLKKSLSLILEMEELWLQTRGRVEFETRLIRDVRNIKDGIYKNIPDVSQIYHNVVKGSYQKTGNFYKRAKVGLYHKAVDEIPLQLKNIWEDMYSTKSKFSRINHLFSYMHQSRDDLNIFWKETINFWQNKKLWKIDPGKVVFNFAKDISLSTMFVHELITAHNRILLTLD